MARLNQVSGAQVPHAEYSKEELLVGRDQNQNDIVISDSAVSRRHARIQFDGGRWRIRDLDSRNRTLINGAPVAEHVLREGDQIQIGGVVFEYHDESSEGRALLRIGSKRQTPGPEEPRRTMAMTPINSFGPEVRDLRALQKDHENLTALYTVCKELNADIEDLHDLIAHVLRVAIREVRGEAGFIALKEPGANQLMEPDFVMNRSGETIEGITLSRTICNEAFLKQRSVLTKDAVHEYVNSESIIEGQILSAMCVPLLYRGESIGIIYVDNSAQAGRFSQRDLEFLTCVADLAAIAISNAYLYRDLRRENLELTERVAKELKLVGRSPSFVHVLKQIQVVAGSEITVLITGESGTGKELIARGIHRESSRHEGPFVPVNCAALPQNLIEMELFGYAANSGIAGANPKGKPGRFELADGGTLFLDEIGDMKTDVQATILRVLQDRRVERLGGTTPIDVDVRVVAATNKDLAEGIDNGEFRRDLFFRLNGFSIAVPPLRERPEDIEPLVEYFIQRHSRDKKKPRPNTRVLAALKRHSWPGNVRELESVVARALLFSDRTIGVDALPESVIGSDRSFQSYPTLKQVEEAHIKKALDVSSGNITLAAKILDIHRKTLHEKIKTLGIDVDSFKK